ncbi:PIN domain-containing protein [Cellulomonas pakistanensis]|uniref:PIN domain-containing protein n=1 Tax=Cellulomonas pakistanensis TaxID=992287 RepID=UPI001EF1C94E|nr:PIN domain-containing protein [Cellulomonas pakistanensis]
MRTLRVLADANVLYSRTLRDWLVLIQLQAEAPPYRTYWTEDIVAEVLYRQRRAHPEWDGRRIALVRDRICGSLEGGRIEDFAVDGEFPGDRHDQHVHAAAVAAGMDVVLTSDSGFSAPAVRAISTYEVCAPDAFFVRVDAAAPDLVQPPGVPRPATTALVTERPTSTGPCAGRGAPASPSGCAVTSWRTTTSEPGRTGQRATTQASSCRLMASRSAWVTHRP